MNSVRRRATSPFPPCCSHAGFLDSMSYLSFVTPQPQPNSKKLCLFRSVFQPFVLPASALACITCQVSSLSVHRCISTCPPLLVGNSSAYRIEDANEDTIGVLVRLITEKKGKGRRGWGAWERGWGSPYCHQKHSSQSEMF